MQKVAILADSIACLTPEMVRQYQLRIIPINIHFDGNIYRDGVDITSAEAYRLLDTAPDYFASSQLQLVNILMLIVRRLLTLRVYFVSPSLPSLVLFMTWPT